MEASLSFCLAALALGLARFGFLGLGGVGGCLLWCLLACWLAGWPAWFPGLPSTCNPANSLKLTRYQSMGWWCHEPQMVLLTAELGLLSI